MYDNTRKTVSLFLKADIDRLWVVRSGTHAGVVLLSVSPTDVITRWLKPIDIHGDGIYVTADNVMKLSRFLDEGRRSGYALVARSPTGIEKRLKKTHSKEFIWSSSVINSVAFDSEGEVILFRTIYKSLFNTVDTYYVEVRKKIKDTQ